jgi:hypothetical protein
MSMEMTESKAGRTKRIIYVLALVGSIVITSSSFIYARMKQLEAEEWHQRAAGNAEEAVMYQEELTRLRRELDSCNRQAALARARATAAASEVQRLRSK